jgi:hypothetical protein
MRTRLLTLLASAVALLACPGPASAGVTEFATGLTPGGEPADIATGPDGNLWFTEQGLVGGIGRITPAGDITEYVAGLTPGFSLGHIPSHIHRRVRRRALVHGRGAQRWADRPARPGDRHGH